MMETASTMETANTAVQKTCSPSARVHPICSNPRLEHLSILCFGSSHCSLCLPQDFGFHRWTAQTSRWVPLTDLVQQNYVHRCSKVNYSFATHDLKVPRFVALPVQPCYHLDHPSGGLPAVHSAKFANFR